MNIFPNWRKPLVFGLLKAQSSPIIDELRFVRSIEWKSVEEVRKIQNSRLEALLLHAWENTEYYREVLSDCGVVVDGEVHLEQFSSIPCLTKDIIRDEATRLRAKSLPEGRKPYFNRTGGSTGNPMEFWQDSYYYAVNVATKFYHFEMLGKQVGESEMKLWGSERDLFTDSSSWKVKLRNYLYNRSIQSCLSLSEDGIRSIVERINRVKPKNIWAYVDAAYTIAEFVNRSGLRVHPPAAIFCSGGTLHPPMAESIGKAFGCPAVNFYGSREMGDVACECKEKAGLHISSHSHYVEVVDSEEMPVVEQEGDLLLTSLANYTMPFIRYRIGDRGKLTDKKCPCGRGFPLLESVLGRSMESFITAKGEVISPIFLFFATLTCITPGLVWKFQLVQDDYSHVTIKIIENPGANRDQLESDLEKIADKMRSVLGQDCVLKHEIVQDLPPTDSGKYLHTVCKIPAPDASTAGPGGTTMKKVEL